MAVEHKDLTGTQLHEPKGCATAPAGTVYVANGSGSGVWQSPLANVNNINHLALQSVMTDLGAPSSVYFNAPVKSTLTKVNVLLYGVLDADTALTIKIGGVLFADSLTLVAAGSSAGQRQSLTVVTTNTINEDTLIEIISNGAATSSVRADIQIELTAVA